MGETVTYTLPTFKDPEGQPTSLSLPNSLPSYVTYVPTTFTISPPFTQGNTSEYIDVNLFDGVMTNTYSIYIECLNDEPTLSLTPIGS